MRCPLLFGALFAIVAASVNAQDPPTGWFIFNGSKQRCEAGPSPAEVIRGYQRLQEPVSAHDVKDSFGTVVQTTLTVPIGGQVWRATTI